MPFSVSGGRLSSTKGRNPKPFKAVSSSPILAKQSRRMSRNTRPLPLPPEGCPPKAVPGRQSCRSLMTSRFSVARSRLSRKGGKRTKSGSRMSAAPSLGFPCAPQIARGECGRYPASQIIIRDGFLQGCFQTEVSHPPSNRSASKGHNVCLGI